MLPKKVLPFLWYFVRKCKYAMLTTYSFAMLNDILYIILGSYIYKLLSNEANQGALTFNNAILYILIYCYMLVSYCFVVSITKKLETRWKTNIEYNMEIKTFINTIKHEVNYFNNNLSGSLNNKIQNLLDNTNNIFINVYYIINYNLAFIIGTLMFYFIDKTLALICIVWYILFHIALIPLLNRYNLSSQKNSSEKSKSMGIINDCFINISNIKIFSSERKEYRTIKKQSGNVLRSESKVMKGNNLLDLTSYFFTSTFIVLIVSTAFIKHMNARTKTPSIPPYQGVREIQHHMLIFSK